MKVLVLGLPRTGTQSLADALIQLGVSPVYHMREVSKNGHQELWIEAMAAKFESKGLEWDLGKFEQILGGYKGAADYPVAIFATELIAAYPDASIILSTRSPEGWYDSMLSTLVHQHRNRPAGNASLMATMARMYHGHCWGDEFDPVSAEAFLERHNQTVREAAKGRLFLEYEPGSGWEPLCKFLGVEVPESEFPHSDDWVDYKRAVLEEEQRKVSLETE